MRAIPWILSLILIAGNALADQRVAVPSRIPKRGLISRIFTRTPLDRLAKEARKADPGTAKQLLGRYASSPAELAKTSIPELRKLLKAAPDAATRDLVFRSYVKFWTPSLAGNVSELMDLSGKGLNANQDYLVMRRVRDRFFSKGQPIKNDSLENAGNRDDFMWLASNARSTPRKGRSLSARDFLLARYAKALGTDLGHAKSEFRMWEKEQEAARDAARAKREADWSQTTATINTALTTINAMNTMRR